MARKKKTFEQYMAEYAAIEKSLPPAEQVDRHRDTFKPPAEPRMVKCLHCGQTYSSDEMRWEYRLHFQAAAVEEWKRDDAFDLEPLWWCKTKNCDGAGYGFDIHEKWISKEAA